MSNRRKKVFSGFIWRLAERFGAQGVSFVVSIILARLVEPKAHGTIAIALVLTTIMTVIVDSGLGTSLIQKVDADDLDFSSVFFFNSGLCLILYLLTFFVLSPALAAFYHNPQLIPLTRVLGISIVFNGVKNVQFAYVSKHMQFKRFFFSTLLGTVFAAILGVWMAYHGYGVWALVLQQLLNTVVDTVVLWITVEWKPKLQFSWRRIKRLFRFGGKIFVANIFGIICENMNQLVVGKFYSETELAYYNKGAHYPEITVCNIIPAIDGVIFPTMAEEQNNNENLKTIARRGISLGAYIVSPIMLGLASCADSFVRVVLTDVWVFSIPILQIFCLNSIIRPLVCINVDIFNALGKGEVTLKMEIAKRLVGLALLFASIPFGVKAMALSVLISTCVAYILNAFVSSRLIGYRVREQFRDILPSFLVTGAMGAIVLLVGRLNINLKALLLLQVAVGVVVYILLSFVFHLDSFHYVASAVLGMLSRKKKDDSSSKS
ncbi:MAG: lipopolysaccharide biosynthesis protein [Spirochaetales bacterium]|nr:lipopolysaccharide biosynthesis protein [Candidatus Physcosoma equi]